MRTTVKRAREETGFTLVEVLVASIILAVGIFAAFTTLGVSARRPASLSRLDGRRTPALKRREAGPEARLA